MTGAASRERDRRADALRRRATALLGDWPQDAGGRADELLGLVASISDVLAAKGPADRGLAGLGRLAADLQELALDLYRHDATGRALRLAGFDRTLRRLQQETSTARLVERACDEARLACGLERVMLSRVDVGRCHPWRVNDEQRSAAWFVGWEDGDIDLRALSLAHVVAEGRPDVIPTDGPDNHELVRLSHSTSYVVAPVMPAGEVVGLFHADHGGDARPCDEADRDVLRLFAELFGHLYERAFLIERVHAQHQQIREALTVVERGLAPGAEPPPRPAAAPPPGLEELTGREHEVLDLLAQGLDNATIAERLGIARPTVKTHVGRILGKLGASSRAEVVARLHGRA